MRVVLIALLLQFLLPVFLPIVTQAGDMREDAHATAVHAHHSSIVIPQLLKEKDDETELNDDTILIDYVALIDFTDHSFVLTRFHESKLRPYLFAEHINCHPPLYTLFGVFLI